MYVFLYIQLHTLHSTYREKLKRKFMAGAIEYDRKVVFGTQHLTTTRTLTTFSKVWNFPWHSLYAKLFVNAMYSVLYMR